MERTTLFPEPRMNLNLAACGASENVLFWYLTAREPRTNPMLLRGVKGFHSLSSF